MNIHDDILKNNISGASADRAVVSAPNLDLAKYRALAEDLEITKEDADEFLRTLWSIMDGFVQNAWDVRIIPAFLPEISDDPAKINYSEVVSDEEDTDDEA